MVWFFCFYDLFTEIIAKNEANSMNKCRRIIFRLIGLIPYISSEQWDGFDIRPPAPTWLIML